MILPSFELHRPSSLAEAVDLVRGFEARGESYDFLSGGTDLLANYKCKINVKRHVISLRHLPELLGISRDSIGAGELLWQIAESQTLLETIPALAKAAEWVASPLIRESATIGGNLLQDTRCYHFNQTYWWRVAHESCLKAEADVCRVVPGEKTCVATYCGDIAPVLLCMGASVRLVGPDGSREVPLSAFYVDEGIQRFVKKRTEILAEVRIPAEARRRKVAYRKLRLRQSIDFPDAGIAFAAELSGSRVLNCWIASTAVGSAALLHPEVAQKAVGKELGEPLAEELASALVSGARPYRNTFFAPGYRKEMLGVLLRRAMAEVGGFEPAPTQAAAG